MVEAGISNYVLSPKSSIWTTRHYHIWAPETALPAEGVYDQEVANHASDADSEDDRADGVVGVVRHVHGGEGLWSLGQHRHLEDESGNHRTA